MTPEERAMLIEAAKAHPDLLECMRMIVAGEEPEPRRQKQKPHLAPIEMGHRQ